MAVRLALHYIPRSSAVHRWDARTKLFGIAAVTGALLCGEPVVFGVVTGGFIVLLAAARLPWHLPLRTIRAWAPFLIFLLLVQATSWESLQKLPKSLPEVFPPAFRNRGCRLLVADHAHDSLGRFLYGHYQNLGSPKSRPLGFEAFPLRFRTEDRRHGRIVHALVRDASG